MPGGAVLLAAGASRRFGSDKRMHQLPGGEPLLHATVEKYLRCFARVVVVLRPEERQLSRSLEDRFGDAPPQVVSAALAHRGMGHSLAAGITAASGWDYAFVALADMPFVEAATLRRLVRVIQTADSAAIVLPSFHGTPGHPVGFGRDHFAALRQLAGDAGARSVIIDHQQRVVDVAVDDPGVLRDIDRPGDLES